MEGIGSKLMMEFGLSQADMESLGGELMMRGVDFNRLTPGDTEMLDIFINALIEILYNLGATYK